MKFRCIYCNEQLEADEGAILSSNGKIQCPNCNNKFIVKIPEKISSKIKSSAITLVDLVKTKINTHTVAYSKQQEKPKETLLVRLSRIIQRGIDWCFVISIFILLPLIFIIVIYFYIVTKEIQQLSIDNKIIIENVEEINKKLTEKIQYYNKVMKLYNESRISNPPIWDNSSDLLNSLNN